LALKESKIHKQGVSGTTRHVTLKIPDILEIIRKPGSSTSQSVIKTPYKIRL
jgi:hypothetical protein